MDPDLESARRVGTTLRNKWTLERLIGTGGMAAVYVGVHKIGRREAIKILHPEVARDPDLRARFEQEAHAVNRFKHPGAVEIRDIDVAEDGAPFLVMELLEGDSLSELARRPNGVALPELLRIVDELLDVLAAAHAQGIIHRDVKPDNLFVMRDGRLKVLDFGIARVRRNSQSKPRTRVGATLGTAPYMPPEQIKGQEIDARADIFAVGATMFRLIAKRRVHDAQNETETLVKMASEPAPPLSSVAPDAPRDVCLVVDRALMFDRANRYPDAATMQEDIRALRESRPPPYAHAKLLEGGTPSPSAMRVPAVFFPPSTSVSQGTVTGHEPTSFATESAAASANGAGPATKDATPIGAGAVPFYDGAASGPKPPAPAVPIAALPPPPPLEMTAAASPIAIEAASSAPASSAVPTLERSTQPMVPTTANGAPSSDLEQSLPQIDATTPPSGGVYRPPGADRTLRSAPADAQNGVPARAHGYAAPAPVPAPAAGSGPAPRTQPAGAEPLPPGATIPVVGPTRQKEPHILLLVLVGVAFAALGVCLTLWLMLRGPKDKPVGSVPAASATTDPDGPDVWPPNPKRPAPRATTQPQPQPQPRPQPQPQQPQQPQYPQLPPIQLPRFEPPPPNQGQPPQDRPDRPDRPTQPGGKGHGKGHGKRD